MKMYNPLEQFTVIPLIFVYNDWIDLTVTNSTIMMLISLVVIIFAGKTNNKIVANKSQRFIELAYIKVEEIVNPPKGGVIAGGGGVIAGGVGNNQSKYIPLIINIFIFILLQNVLGLIPYSFTTTSHIAITLTFSLSIIIGVTFIGFRKHSLGFFNLFIPSGLNKGYIKFLIPLIFIIELISYFTRIISLSVRLTANMMSGHTLLKIIANFGLNYNFAICAVSAVVLIPVVLLELGVAVIQAYVFAMLTASYIKDAELLH